MPVTLRNTDILFNDGTTQATNAAFAAGTAMMFVQTAAPTGWTKSTAHDNKALRVVTGTAGSGGSAAFTTAFGTPSVTGSLSGTVGNHTLTTAQIPSHTHLVAASGNSQSSLTSGNRISATGTTGYSLADYVLRGSTSAATIGLTSAVGSGSAHGHSFSGSLSSATASINVQYVDVIIATRN
jgi:hypothetical protein